jgi:Lrp/AsnC family leucine-responsive transcriptional regulator
MRLLDEKDIQILQLLQMDGRITNADLAKHVNLSPPSVLQRVRALESLGVIKTYTAILDPERLGLKLTAWTHISLALHQEMPIERFRKAVQAIPEILECYHVTGEFDFLLKITVKDMRAYELFIREKLSKLKGIGKIQTSFVMGVPKQSTKIDL